MCVYLYVILCKNAVEGVYMCVYLYVILYKNADEMPMLTNMVASTYQIDCDMYISTMIIYILYAAKYIIYFCSKGLLVIYSQNSPRLNSKNVKNLIFDNFKYLRKYCCEYLASVPFIIGVSVNTKAPETIPFRRCTSAKKHIFGVILSSHSLFLVEKSQPRDVQLLLLVQ